MKLEQEIEERAREINTDGYAMSVGEMLSMHREGDLDVHPEFQRIFRWTEPQKSRLIESILLGIPIPMIFVAQRADGVWDVIDGVQRLSTILEFVGENKDEDGMLLPPLTLGPTEYLPQLEGLVWQSNDPERSFSEVLRRNFKRARLEFRIVKNESDPNAKYDLFQRLNSGTTLTQQESRNCLLVMLDADFYRWLGRLAEDADFRAIVPLTDRREDEGFRQELVLRFFMQLTFEWNGGDLPKELGEHLTDWVRAKVGNLPDLNDWKRVFSRTFAVLNEALQDDAFRKYDSAKRKFLGGFSISAFEAITSGVAWHLDYWDDGTPGRKEELAERIRGLWDDDRFKSSSGSGVSPRRRTPRLINRSREVFAPDHGDDG